MLATQIQEHARQLLEARGAQALVDAAQKASELERDGNIEQAQTWRRIEQALRLMHGPRET